MRIEERDASKINLKLVFLIVGSLASIMISWRFFLSDDVNASADMPVNGNEKRLVTPSTREHRSNQHRIRQLENRLFLIELKLSEINRQLNACRMDDETGDQLENADEEHGGIEQKNADSFGTPEAANVNGMTAQMIEEAYDSDWNQRIRQQFDDILYQTGITGTTLLETDCRETMCRISIGFENARARERALPQLGFLASPGEEVVIADNEDTTDQVEYYLRRIEKN
jgi:hypothetical protein